MAIPHHAQSCSACRSIRPIFPVLHRFRGCCLPKWKRKSPQLTRVQRSLAQHCSHNSENVAVMSSSPQPWVDPSWQTEAWQPPAEPHSTTRDRCHLVPTSTTILPSHPDLLAVYRHTSPPCLPGEHWAIWDLEPHCADMAPTILGLVLLIRVYAVPSLTLS